MLKLIFLVCFFGFGIEDDQNETEKRWFDYQLCCCVFDLLTVATAGYANVFGIGCNQTGIKYWSSNVDNITNECHAYKE